MYLLDLKILVLCINFVKLKKEKKTIIPVHDWGQASDLFVKHFFYLFIQRYAAYLRKKRKKKVKVLLTVLRKKIHSEMA